MNKKVFITGVTGQIGSYVAEQFLNDNYEVIGMKRRTSTISTQRIDSIYKHSKFKLVYGNMSDTGCFWQLFTEHQPDIIINAAAQSHVRVSFDVSEETMDVTANGVLRLLNAAKTIVPDARIFQFSSSEMFGINEQVPQNEKSLMIPASPYGCAKLAAHMMIRNYRQAYNMFACTGICFNSESPRRGETFVTRKITIAAARIKLGMQEKLFLGNLDAKRDWTHANDTARAVKMIIEHTEPDDFVISSGRTNTVKDFVCTVFDYAGIKGDPMKYIEIDPRLMRPEEVPILFGDSAKAKKILGWKPFVSFEDLCKIMYLYDYNEIKDYI